MGQGSARLSPSANFERADLRGATVNLATGTPWLNLKNTIRPDGAIEGLALGDGETLLVRNFDPVVVTPFGRPPIALLPTRILVKQFAEFGNDSHLELFFDEAHGRLQLPSHPASPWSSRAYCSWDLRPGFIPHRSSVDHSECSIGPA